MSFPGRVAVSSALGVGLVAGVALALAVLPRADLGPEVAAKPGAQRLDGWAEAAAVAGITLYAPSGEANAAEIVVRGVAGDATRPIEARFEGGLVLVQAHRDLLPPETGGQLIRVPGADDGWWQSASDGRRLAVRFGDTLVLLTGATDDDLLETARKLAPVGSIP